MSVARVTLLPISTKHFVRAQATLLNTSFSSRLPPLKLRHQAAWSSTAPRTFATNTISYRSSSNSNLRLTHPTSRASQSQVRHCSCRRNMCRGHLDSDAPASASMDITQGREILPANVKPTHYDLTLEPDLEKFTFKGRVIIDLDVVERTSSITVNTQEIDVSAASIDGLGSSVKASDVSQNKDAQTTTFSFDDHLKAGTQTKLDISFTGTLNDSLAGFYRSTYKDAKGNKKIMATTQMEATDARRAFPCFDEPALKAKFTVTLVADKELTCLSNMDVKSEKEQGSKKAVTFNTSPPMSTYLLAFVVGELNYIENNDFRVPIRIYATPDQEIERGRFSADLAAKTLDFYEKKFDSKFPLPKMDMIAIPDFSAGAMENWGLITYRVVDLMFDEKTSDASTKQRVAEVVQHELAHQWFGNLVTMDFWDGLWLNEGFATWMSWYSCNAFYPEWKVWESYVTDTLQGALSLDSLRSSHPIEVPVKRADEINQIFDAISYSKGSCVLRMVSKYIGEETFLEGIRRYLKKHAYGNTQTGDLWAALSDASGEPIEKIMTIWTKNVGYPVVTVTEDEKAGTIHVKQNRFLRTADVKPEEDKTLYPVLLSLRTKNGVSEDYTLFEREKSFKVPDMEFFKINALQSGIYRTFYTPSRLAKLGEASQKGLLPVEDRAGVIADAGALSASGYSRSSATLELLKSFSKETEFVVWDELLTWIGSLRGAWMFEDQKTKDAIKAFKGSLVVDKAHSLGWTFSEEDGNIQQQFKARMFASAGEAGDKKILAAAREMFDKFTKGDRDAIHPNIRGGVFGLIMQEGNEKDYDALLHEYHTAEQHHERLAALRALGRAEDPKLIKRSLDLALSDDVRTQDIYVPLGGLRSHPEGIKALWTWFKTNWDVLVKKLPPGLSMLGSVVQICCSSFTTEAQKADVEQFFASKDTKGFDRSLAQSLDAVTARIQWLERDGKDVAEWLKANGYY